MTSPWSGTSAWVNGAVVGASNVNDHINNNLDHLKAPPFAQIISAIDTPATVTATTAVPITAGVSAVLTTYGAPVQVYFKMRSTITGTTFTIFNLLVDNTAYTTRVSGLARGNNQNIAEFHEWITGLASGSHTFVPTWKVQATGTGYTQASGEPLRFWVREG